MHIIWGLDGLSQDLRRIATQEEEIVRPPEPEHSRNEWEAANRIQFRPDGGEREAAAATESPATESPATDPAGGAPLGLEARSITIHRVDTLIIQCCPLHPDVEREYHSSGA